jgi:hypothetical protein
MMPQAAKIRIKLELVSLVFMVRCVLECLRAVSRERLDRSSQYSLSSVTKM